MRKITLLISLLTCIFFYSCSNDSQKVIKKPNVLFIAVDDLNDWIEPLGGHSQAITPNLSRLADEGVNFKRAYTAAPACNPSRSALMTGQYPHNTGMYSNLQIWREVLGMDVKTIPQYFTENGYWAAGAGKIFHNNQPDPQSWTEYFPSKENHMPDYHHPGNGNQVNMPEYDNLYNAFDWSPISLLDQQTGDYQTVDWIIDQLNKEHNKPFFLAAGIYRPHLPWYVPQKYFDMHPLDSVKLPNILEGDRKDLPPASITLARTDYHEAVVKHGLWREAVQGYLASITYADAMVGELLDALENSPYAENTIVVLWSDHGWQLGEKKHWRKYHLWENIAHVVLVMKVPKGVAALPEGSVKGVSSNRTVSLIDIFPTLVELCNLPEKENLDGHSLVPLLKNPNQKWRHLAITTSRRVDFAVAKENWRYILYNNGDEELYNHNEDPEEWYNLAKDPKYEKIKKQLKSYVPDDPHPYVESDYRGNKKELEKYTTEKGN